MCTVYNIYNILITPLVSGLVRERARGFWDRMQCAFFDIYPNAQSNATSYNKHETNMNQIKDASQGHSSLGIHGLYSASVNPILENYKLDSQRSSLLCIRSHTHNALKNSDIPIELALSESCLDVFSLRTLLHALPPG